MGMLTVNKRIVKSKKISKQDLYDVLENFYKLGNDITDDMNENMNNYTIIRMVTIIEQFCRCIIEAKLEKHSEQFPQKIEIKHQLLDDLLETASLEDNKSIKNALISMSYSFQSADDICGEMQNFGLFSKQSALKNKIIELEPLFQARHALIHTVEPGMLDVKQIASYSSKIEDMIHGILDTLDIPMYDFDILKGRVFGEMAERVCLRNMPNIESRDKSFDMFGNTKDIEKLPWFGEAKKFHDVTVDCFESALRRFLTRVKNNPPRFDVLSEIAWTYKTMNEHYESEKFADIMLKSDPENTVACYCKGISLLNQDRRDAVTYFKKAIVGSTYLRDAYMRVIEFYLDHGNAEGALVYVDQIIIMELDEPVWYILKSRILGQLKLYA